jgi:ribose transport system substrate-binding protein
MSFRNGLAVVAVLCIAAAVGCGGPGDDTKPASPGVIPTKSGLISLAVVPTRLGPDFWEQVRLGAECAASKQREVTVHWYASTPNIDAVGQINLLRNLMLQDVDGIIYAATDAASLAPITEEALDRGKAVVNIDSGTYPQPPAVPLFATDNVVTAAKAADLLANALGSGEKQIAYLPYRPGTATNDQRTQGFKQGLARHPNLKIVAEQSSEGDYGRAVSVTEHILATTPELDGIFAPSETNTLGAATAVQQAGKAGQVKIVGWDAAPDEVKRLEAGIISGLVVQHPFQMGYDGVNAAVTKLREGATPPSRDTGVSFLSAENLTSAESRALLKPSCDKPPIN